MAMAKKDKSRRPNHDGAIYMDGDCWRVQILVGRDPVTGKPRFKKRRVRCEKKEDALDVLHALQAEHRQGKLAHSGNTTLGAFVEHWLETKIKPMRAPKTYQQYRWVLRTHVLPTLGRKRIDKVVRADVQALVGQLSRQPVQPRAKNPTPAQKPTKTLSRRTLASAVAVLRSVYTDAMRDGLCVANPCQFIELPRQAKKAPQALTPCEVLKLVEALQGSPVRDIVTFLIATGARLGEARGLRWQDIDFKTGIVKIRGQLQSIGGNLVYVATTKTNQDREVPLDPTFVQRLRELQTQQDVDGITDPEGIVFLNPEGRRLHEKYVYNFLHRACASAKIQLVSPHKLRHTAATIALMETGDTHGVQLLLGHGTGRLTTDLYGHGSADRVRGATRPLSRLLFGPKAEG